MKKYQVYGTVRVGVYMEVEAETSEGAKKEAMQNFSGLSSYVGNGGVDKLVGVYDENVSLDADGYDLEINSVEELT